MTQALITDSGGDTALPEQTAVRMRRAAIISLTRYHFQPSVILIAATLVLFRTWIGRGYPGGTDSAFLYSGAPIYATHGLQLFTVWLPSPLGQVSQYSLYWFLAMLMVVFRGAVFTYKLMAVSLALLSAFGMYAISWSWTKSRTAAVAAAVFYSFSPFSVSQWLSGHLDVQTSIALGPLAIWSITRVLDTGSKRAAVGLGLCLSALLLLTTGQAAYWVPVALVVIVGKLLVAPREIPAMLRRSVPGAVLALAVFVAASSVQVIPWVFGASAAFAGGQSLSIETLALHANYSLPFDQNIVGVPREAWLPAGVDLSIASFSSVLFVVPVVIITVFASLSVVARKSLSIVFLVLAVSAWYLATGPFGPTAGAYTSIWQHIILFRELRVPNRWLMVSTFSVASMLALSIRSVTGYRTGSVKKGRGDPDVRNSVLHPALAPLAAAIERSKRSQLVRTSFRAVLLVVISGSLLAINDGAAFARGLPTINLPNRYTEAYSVLRKTPGDWRVLTTPVNQEWMEGPVDGDPENIAADLGYTSTLFNGHSTLGNGGWDPRASEFSRFLDALVNQGVDRNITELLAAADIRYVVLDPEPAYQVPVGQGSFLSTQYGLERVSGGQGFTVLENPSAQSQISQPTSSCVIAGGYPVVEDLTEDPSFSLQNTALYFADQVVGTSGWNALARMLTQDHCLIVGPGGEGELNVLRNTVASVQASAISPAQWPSAPIGPLADSQANPAQSVEIPAGKTLTWDTTIRTAGSYRVWVRVLRQPSASVMPVTVNGVSAGAVNPAWPASVGYQWLPANAAHFAAGSARITLSGSASGLSPEIAEIAVVRDDSTTALPAGIKPNWLVQDVDSQDSSLYSQPSVSFSQSILTSTWRAVSGVKVTDVHGAAATLVPISTSRPQFSVVNADLPSSIDPNEPLAFRFQGTGNGAMFYLNFYFRDGSRKSFGFQDSTSQPRVLFVTPDGGGAAVRAGNPAGSADEVPKWDQVERLTLSTNSLYSPGGTIRIDGPSPLKSGSSFPYFTGHLPATTVSASSGAKLMTGVVSTGARIQDLRQGILDFSQSFDPHWQLSGTRSRIHTVELGFENSYFATQGTQQARLTYSLAGVGEFGTIVSLLVWIMGLGVLIAGVPVEVLRPRRSRYNTRRWVGLVRRSHDQTAKATHPTESS